MFLQTFGTFKALVTAHAFSFFFFSLSFLNGARVYNTSSTTISIYIAFKSTSIASTSSPYFDFLVVHKLALILLPHKGHPEA